MFLSLAGFTRPWLCVWGVADINQIPRVWARTPVAPYSQKSASDLIQSLWSWHWICSAAMARAHGLIVNKDSVSVYMPSARHSARPGIGFPWTIRVLCFWMSLLLLCGAVNAGKGRRGREGRMGRRSWRNRCPVMPPCYCDFGVSRYGRTKRIVCGILESDFPTFSDSREVLDCVTLMYTGLTHVPPEGFANIRATMIDLQGNNFGGRINEKAFAKISRNLESLNLAWANITDLHPKVFKGMVHLKNVTLAENKIRNIPLALFQDLRSLEKISLAGNPIGTLPPTLFASQNNLAILDMGYCQLQTLNNRVFSKLWNLQVLDLRGNSIREITPGTFGNLWSLKDLMLSHNLIERIRKGDLRGLSNLGTLELKEGRLRFIEPGSFADTPMLDTLDIGDNFLHSIPDGVLAIPTVEWLSLDGNGLTQLPQDVSKMSELIYMDLSYNRLETLDRCIFTKLRNLEYINLRQNPFNCDCDLIWLRTLQTNLVRHWEYTRLLPFVPGHCAKPDDLRGVGVTSWINVDCRKERRYTACADDD